MQNDNTQPPRQGTSTSPPPAEQQPQAAAGNGSSTANDTSTAQPHVHSPSFLGENVASMPPLTWGDVCCADAILQLRELIISQQQQEITALKLRNAHLRHRVRDMAREPRPLNPNTSHLHRINQELQSDRLTHLSTIALLEARIRGLLGDNTRYRDAFSDAVEAAMLYEEDFARALQRVRALEDRVLEEHRLRRQAEQRADEAEVVLSLMEMRWE